MTLPLEITLSKSVSIVKTVVPLVVTAKSPAFGRSANSPARDSSVDVMCKIARNVPPTA